MSRYKVQNSPPGLEPIEPMDQKQEEEKESKKLEKEQRLKQETDNELSMMNMIGRGERNLEKTNQLNQFNYDSWKRRMKFLLEGNLVWSAIEENEEYKREKENVRKMINNLAMSMIRSNVTDPALRYVSKGETAKEIWRNLEERYEENKEEKAKETNKKFWQLAFNENKSASIYADEFLLLYDDLVGTKYEISKDVLIEKILDDLPQKFNHYRLAMDKELEQEEYKKEIGIKEFLNKIIREEERIARITKRNVRTNDVNQRSSSSSSSFSSKTSLVPVCYNCGKGGHKANECKSMRSNTTRKFSSTYSSFPSRSSSNTSVQRTTKPFSNSSFMTAPTSNKTTPTRMLTIKKQEKEKEDKERSELKEELSAVLFSGVQKLKDEKRFLPRNIWIVDSGASSHITFDHKKLKNKRKSETKEVIIGDDTAMLVQAEGEVNVKFENKERIVNGILENVLYVPGTVCNILSVSCLDEKGYSLVFENGLLLCKQKETNKIIFEGKRDKEIGNLWVVCEVGEQKQEAKEESEKNVEKEKEIETETLVEAEKKEENAEKERLFLNADLTTWHERMGHCDSKNIERMERNKTVKDLKIKGRESFKECEVCKETKLTSSPYKAKNDLLPSSPLEIISVDICGPFQVQGQQGERYFLLIIDNFSRYAKIYLQKQKNEATKNLKKYVVESERELKRKIKIIRSDNGGEFENNNFNEFCNKLGIKRQLTIAYNPQQNGLAERMNRTLVESIRCLLKTSGLSKSFWPEALLLATYVKNCKNEKKRRRREKKEEKKQKN